MSDKTSKTDMPYVPSRTTDGETPTVEIPGPPLPSMSLKQAIYEPHHDPVLSRRDEFAIRLAQGELAGTAPGEEWGSEEQRAKWVVKATDALIAELDKDKEQNDG